MKIKMMMMLGLSLKSCAAWRLINSDAYLAILEQSMRPEGGRTYAIH